MLHKCAISKRKMEDVISKKILTKIAGLYYLEELTQQEIADKLNISRTRVSRYLDRAKKNGIVEIKINSLKEYFSSLEYEIEDRFKIKECIVVPAFEKKEKTLKMMGDALNDLFERVLEDGSYLGIGWGSSLKEVADHIHVRGKSGIKVVPIIGGLGKTGTGFHTNSVAKNIADRLKSISYMINSPAILDSRQIREIVENDSNTLEIFKLSEKIDTALVGLGDIGPDSTLFKAGCFTMEELEYLEGLGVVGDINLIFINKNGEHVPNRIDERIVRISPERLKKVKNVIGVAFGKRKTRVILGALRGKFINMLITDEETAKNINIQG